MIYCEKKNDNNLKNRIYNMIYNINNGLYYTKKVI